MNLPKSELEELRQELKQTQLAYQMAAQMSEFKAGFLARASHEIRSPLSSLIGLHQLILSDLCDSPEEQKEFIAQAYQSALKLMKLIDEIVAVAKTEYGSNKLHLESLPLTEILTGVYHLTHLQAANRNLQLKIATIDPTIQVIADRNRLIQSLVNLIDSGISLMDEGLIEIKAVTDDTVDLVKIEIDIQCAASLWQESKDSLAVNSDTKPEKISQLAQEVGLSPQMRLLLSQTLLETMGGDLDFMDLSAQREQVLTRLTLTCRKAEDTA